ncbi:MAG TPA: FAD-dependent oxidoreductase [Longimicrobiales bacterium]|nr:FAD-dependent oxidoreductase [Longimicrobiales bacterium]
MSERLGVIGAGVAGLAAAWRLVEAGRQVVVYEAAPVAGGLLATVERAGIRADTGVQLLSSTYVETRRLIAAAGASGLLAGVPGRDALWRRGRARPITYGAVASMLATGALPAMLKLRLGAKYVPFLSTRAAHADANDPAATAAAHDGESIAAWGRRELGDDFVEYLAYPLLGAYYGATPERASAGLYHALARVGMDVHLSAVRGGAARLAAALSTALTGRGVELRTGAAVTSLQCGEAEVRLQAGGGAEQLAGVVVATDPAQARKLLAGESALAGWLAGVVTAPAITVTAWLRRRVNVDWFGVSFPRVEPPGDVLVAACVQSRKPELVEGAGDAVVMYPAPAWMAAHADAPDAALRDALLPALERAFPGITRVTDDVSVHRHAGGYRVFEAGQLRRIAAFDDAMVPPRCALAGDYLVAPTVEGAVRSGLRAAARLLA